MTEFGAADIGRLMAAQLTQPQRDCLLRFDERGLLDFRHPNGLWRNNWEKMMGRLRQKGIVEPYVHGGYRLTEVGERTVKWLRHAARASQTR